MRNRNIKIVVSGDICINFVQRITYPQSDAGLNWRTHLNMHVALKQGEFLSSTAELELFPRFYNKNNNGKVYRIKRLMGFTGPSCGNPSIH